MYITSTANIIVLYLLLLQLDSTPLIQPKTALRPLNININSTVEPVVASPKSVTPLTPNDPLNSFSPLQSNHADSENIDPFSPNSDSPSNFTEPRKPSSIRKPQKRIRSPTLDGDYSPGMLYLSFQTS